MKSRFNVSYVKLIICSQFKHPTSPTCRVRLLRTIGCPYIWTPKTKTQISRSKTYKDKITEKVAIITNAKTRLENLERQHLKLRLVVNATCIYITDVEESNLWYNIVKMTIRFTYPVGISFCLVFQKYICTHIVITNVTQLVKWSLENASRSANSKTTIKWTSTRQ
jgi:hypothetical protein